MELNHVRRGFGGRRSTGELDPQLSVRRARPLATHPGLPLPSAVVGSRLPPLAKGSRAKALSVCRPTPRPSLTIRVTRATGAPAGSPGRSTNWLGAAPAHVVETEQDRIGGDMAADGTEGGNRLVIIAGQMSSPFRV